MISPRIAKLLLLCATVSLLGSPAANAAGRVRLKIATIAPDGSSWMKSFRAMDKEVRAATKNRVRFKAYPGGVQGDEKDVLRKIRIGQLHGGGFTGLGMGAIFPDTLVVAVPMLVQTYDEIDYIKEELGDYFRKGIADNGFVLLGWQEVGFVYLMSKTPIRTMDDLRKVRIWAWQGDQVAPAVFREAKINPVYLAVHDVLPALQTGLLDATYSSPLGAVVLQWHTKIKYMNDVPLTYALSGIVVTKKAFDKIPANLQPVVLNICERYLRDQVIKTREDNAKAIEVLKKRGVEMISLAPEARRELEGIFLTSGERLSGKVFSRAVFTKTKKLLAEYRAKKKEAQ